MTSGFIENKFMLFNMNITLGGLLRGVCLHASHADKVTVVCLLSNAGCLSLTQSTQKPLLLVAVPEWLQNRVQSCGVVKVPACTSGVVDEGPASL